MEERKVMSRIEPRTTFQFDSLDYIYILISFIWIPPNQEVKPTPIPGMARKLHFIPWIPVENDSILVTSSGKESTDF